MGDTIEKLDVDRLTRLSRVSAVALSPENAWLAVAVSRLDQDEARYVSDLWRVSLTEPDAPPIQLTRGSHSDTSPQFRPDGALAFLSNRPRGDEPADTKPLTQVWMFPPGGGEPRPITDEPLGVSSFRFARDTGRLFAIADVYLGIDHDKQRAHAADLNKRGPTGLHYTAMPVRHWDYWIPTAAPHLIAYGDGDGNDRVDLTPDADREHREDAFGIGWDVSPDGRLAAVPAARIGKARLVEAALRVIDTDTGAYRDLGATPGLDLNAPQFSPDSRSLACVQTAREFGRGDRKQVWCFDVADPQDSAGRAVAPDWDTWPHIDAWTPDGKALICTAAARGHVPVFAVNVASGEVTRLSSEQAGGSHNSVVVTSDGKTAIGLRSRVTHPPEPFSLAIEPGATPTLVAELSGFTEADSEHIARVTSFTAAGDAGAEIQSFLIQPTTPGPHPTLLWVHGGPMSQWADTWHWRWNALVVVSEGFAILQPNPRGSTGRGQAFIDGIWNNQWGGACYRDLMAVTDATCQRDDIDSERIGAMGGSFGGYMANWIGVNTDRFQCLITHASIYDLGSFSGATDFPSYMHHEMGVTPYEDSETFERHSPHRRIDQWKTPTLVIHGERDYRVPIGEALHLFEALRWRGVDAELLVFPDENHWILRPQNIRLWYRTVIEFAHKHLNRG